MIKYIALTISAAIGLLAVFGCFSEVFWQTGFRILDERLTISGIGKVTITDEVDDGDCD